jgi:hypothetical protein
MEKVDYLYRVLIGYVGQNYHDTNWIDKSGFTESTPTELYNAAFYFISVTLMTVGYGDISGSNYGERAFCIPLVILGAGALAYGIGSVNSIVSNKDAQQATTRQKMRVIYEVHKKVELNPNTLA